MPDTITLNVTEAYASCLDVVRRAYRMGAAEARTADATAPYRRYLGWHRVRNTIEWSVADDTVKGYYRPDDVALLAKVNARCATLV